MEQNKSFTIDQILKKGVNEDYVANKPYKSGEISRIRKEIKEKVDEIEQPSRFDITELKKLTFNL
ncbi:MAG: hypothetical protein QM541_00600 [Flavobacterium sp.]|nr:hypothetical protein [Flavobacterium sp.]